MFDENQFRRYLLGDLTLEEGVSLEEQYFSDSSRFEEVLAAENDLLGAYARGELTDSDRRRVEQRYSESPERIAKIEFAKALRHIAQSERLTAGVRPASGRWFFTSFFNAQKPVLQFRLAFATLMIAGIIWVALQNHLLRKELQQARVDSTQLHLERDVLHDQMGALEAQLEQSHASEQGIQVATLEAPTELVFGLVPGSVRSNIGEQHNLVISQGHPWVRLEMTVEPSQYRAYEAQIITPEGRVILQTTALKSQSVKGADVISWRIPSHSLRFGEYIVKLSGVRDDGSAERVQSYSFRTVPK